LSDDCGLWNPNFRFLRSPIPLLAIRYLVETDAPFVITNLLLIPTYIAKFPIAGPGHLFKMLTRKKMSARTQSKEPRP
jgi:hypothetical protein